MFLGLGPPVGVLQGGIAAGMLQSNIDPSQVNVLCPTYNCTWNAYTTLGFCSSVEDFSSNLSVECTDRASNCTFVIRNSSLSNNSTNTDSWHHKYDDRYEIEGRYINFKLFMDPSLGVAEDRTLIGDMYLLFQRNLSKARHTGDRTPDLGLLKGSLNLCLKNYSSTSLNGTVQTEAYPLPDAPVWKIEDPTDNLTNFAGPILPAGVINNDDKTIRTFVQGTQDKDGTNFTTSQNTIELLSLYLQQYLNWNASIGLLEGGDNYWYSEEAFSLAKDVYGDNLTVYNDTYALEGFKSRMNNLAISMTNL